LAGAVHHSHSALVFASPLNFFIHFSYALIEHGRSELDLWVWEEGRVPT
jgi:hypothetical protein